MIQPDPDTVYEEKINQLIGFYRGRIYLRDSEFKILSDIARDAEKMIIFLETRRESITRELKLKQLDLTPSKINGFVLNKARYSDTGMG